MKASEKALERVSGDDSKWFLDLMKARTMNQKLMNRGFVPVVTTIKIRENRFILSSFSFFSTQTMRIPSPSASVGVLCGASSLRFVHSNAKSTVVTQTPISHIP